LQAQPAEAVVGKRALGMIYEREKKYDQARSLFEQALKTLRGALGPDRPEVATTLTNIAEIDAHQNENAQAERLLRQALKIDLSTLGSHHPAVATDYHNLAKLYVQEGKDAKTLYEKAIAIQKETLGPQHEDLAATLAEYQALEHKSASRH
jgi:tetratricopeptide (TPR) repeat protein